MTVYVVVFYKDGRPVGVTSQEGFGFVVCMLSESVARAIEMGEAVRRILGWDYRVFEEVPE